MSSRRHVTLGTISFMVCFAAWGLIAAFAPRFRETFHLTHRRPRCWLRFRCSSVRWPASPWAF